MSDIKLHLMIHDGLGNYLDEIHNITKENIDEEMERTKHVLLHYIHLYDEEE